MADLHFHILRRDEVTSTNTEAAAQAKRGAAEGTTVVAREQTAGRGRHGRAWASPAGAGLYFSIVLRPRFPVETFPLLTFLAALSVREALQQGANLTTDIKWSNDVLANGRKLCGILAETIETGRGRSVVVGIGINLTRAANANLPSEIAERATSIEAETNRAPDTDAQLRLTLDALKRRYLALHEANGAAQLLDEYARSSSYVFGKAVRVVTGAETFEGATRGLAPDGALRVELPNGELRIVYAGDVNAVRAVGKPEFSLTSNL